MRIYFACSITGGRDFESIYQSIMAFLLAEGHDVPSAHLADARVKKLEAAFTPLEIYERDLNWIRTSDALLAEVSTPSHGVGYEIAYALGLGKPVLCIYREGQVVTKMLTGNSHPNIQVNSYCDLKALEEIIRSFLLLRDPNRL